MKFRKNRKGFTIVELIIVIAVIGVLTAVLVPTIVHLVNKANKASDQSLVSNLNKSLAMRNSEVGKNCETMHEAVESLEPYGYKLDALVTKGDQDLLFNLKQNKFYLANEAEGEAKDLWRIQNKIEENQVYNVYAGSNFETTDVASLTVGFDAGRKSMTSIGYNSSDSTAVLIRAYGEDCVVNITAPNKDVNYYGYSKRINATDVADNSLHIFGGTNQLEVVKGHVDVESTGIVFELGGSAQGSVTNKGFIGSTAVGASVTVSGNQVGGTLKISTLAQLESFRDVVNAGNDFEHAEGVELLEDIKLSNGWKPIGEGARKVGKIPGSENTNEQCWFKGKFNGNNKTISNLNNNGFVPTNNRLVVDDDLDNVKKGTYAWGFFGLVSSGAEISNIKFANVDFDGTRYADANSDSVGALAGYIAGSATIKNVHVLDGKINGYDCVAGIVGRNLLGSNNNTTRVEGCSNAAAITSQSKASGIIFAAGNGTDKLYLIDNTNTGAISGGHPHTNAGWINLQAGISVYGYNIVLTQSGNVNNGHAAAVEEHRVSSGTQGYTGGHDFLL